MKIANVGAILVGALLGCGLEAACTRPGSPSSSSSASAVETIPSWSDREYKILVISASNHERTGPNALASNELVVDEAKLNELGAQGWNLSASWVEPETAFPNLGKQDYVTGIQPNVRPMRAILIFQRPSRL